MLRFTTQPYSGLPALIVLLILFTCAVGAAAFHYTERSMVALAGQSLSVAAANIADELDRLLYERYSDIHLLAQSEAFRHPDAEGMTRHLRAMLEAYPVYVWLGATDANGRLIASTDPDLIGREFSERPWFQAVKLGESLYVTDAQFSEESGGVASVSFSAPLYSPAGAFRGAVTARVALPALADIFQATAKVFQAQTGPSVGLEWQFLSQNGDVIADSFLHQEGRVNVQELGLPSAKLVALGKTGYVEELHVRRGVPVVTGFAQTRGYEGFAGFHWGVLVRQDRTDVVASIRTVLWKIGGAGALVFVPVLGLLLWATRRLQHEQQELHTQTQARQRATEAVRASEARYRALYDDNPSMYFTVDRAGTILSVNSFGAAQLGYPVEELVGQPVTSVFIPEVRQTVQRQLAACFDSPSQVGRWESRKVRKDGSRLLVREAARVVQDTAGRSVCLIVCEDISDRERMEEQVLEQRRFLASIVENLPNMVFVKDAKDLRYVQFNRTGEALLGYPRETMIGKNDFDLFPKDEAEFFTEHDRKVLASGTLLEIPEEPILTRDGSKRILHTTKIPILDDDGTPRYLLGISEDITERKRTEEELSSYRLHLEEIVKARTADLSAANVELAREITRRAEVEHALRSSEARFRRVVDSNMIGILFWNEAGAITDANDAFLHMIGYTRQELQAGRVDWKKLTPPEYFQLDAKALEEIARTGVCTPFEKEYVRKDGTRVPIMIGGAGFDGSVSHGVAFVLDISDRVCAQAALRRSEEHLRLLVETTNVLPWEADAATWRFTYVGPQAVPFLGYPVEQWYRAGFWPEHIHPEDREWAVRFCEESSRTRDHYEFEYRMITADGRTVWLHDQVSVVREAGAPKTLRGFLVDITERKHAEAALRKSEAQYRAVVDHQTEMVCRFLPDTTLTFVNDACCRHFGKSRDQLIGTSLLALVPESQREMLRRHLDSLNATSRTMTAEREVVGPNGEQRWQEWTDTCICDTSGTLVEIQSVGRDITDRKQAEAMRRQLLDKIIAAQEDERRRIARELHDQTGQSLTSLLVGLRTLGETSSLQEAHEQARTLRRVAATTLDEVERISRGLRPSVLDDLGLDAAVQRLARDFTKTHGIPAEVHSNGLQVERLPAAVESALYRIVQEALTNIAKHAASSHAWILMRGTSEGIQVIIEDNGRGFDVETAWHAVNGREPLGLHGIRERARLLNGTLTIESSPGQGTTLFVHIPLSPTHREGDSR